MESIENIQHTQEQLMKRIEYLENVLKQLFAELNSKGIAINIKFLTQEEKDKKLLEYINQYLQFDPN